MSFLGQDEIECPACEKSFMPDSPANELGRDDELECPYCGAVIVLELVQPDVVWNYYGKLKEVGQA